MAGSIPLFEFGDDPPGGFRRPESCSGVDILPELSLAIIRIVA